jgi:hypothetical protein
MIKVELIAVAGCSKCVGKRDRLKSAAKAVAKAQLVWREVDVLDEMDYVVGLGVLTLPAIAINGKLVFKTLPSIPEIEREIRKHLPGMMA